MNQIAPRQGESKLPASKIPLRQVPDVKTMLVNDQARQQLQAVAARHMNPERMMRLMANAMRANPKLGECNPLSLLGAMMQCASLGLEPNTVLGHAYLIPFEESRWNPNTRQREKLGVNVQLIIGYKGYIDLARRSGHITSIAAGIHYSDDETTGGLWEYEEGTESRLRHRPGYQEGEKLHAYAIAKFTDGGHAYVVLPWHKVMKIRDGSQGWQAAVKTAEKYKKPVNSPWATHEDEMAQKTAIRALAKFLPLSTEFRDGLESDGARNADYAAFAMNPVAGLDATPDDDSGYIDHDPETGEVGGDPVIEDQRAAQTTIEQEPARDPAPRQSRAKAEEKPAPRQSRARADDQAGMDLRAPSLSERIKMLDDSIRDMLAENAPLSEVLEMFEPQLDAIKAEDASEHAAMIDAYEKIAADRA
ncbi:recombinase RecT [Paracoccus sp. NSM]|uniref:recombinase RecT n=1 Tax=Paracoccus sp. NSM TaxID=3457784 RepID=UPI0040368099